MTYLIAQILLSLLIAFILGFILGYILAKPRGEQKKKAVVDDIHDSGTDAADANAAMKDKTSQDVADFDMAVINLDTNVDLDAQEYDIQTLEGIGPQTGDIFRGYDIATVGDYLRKLHSPVARKQASQDLNVLEKPLHDWASMADLLRVEGIDHQYAELVYASGISVVSQLANSDADELLNEMATVNDAGKQKIAPELPTAEEVHDWVARARGSSPVVTI